MTSCSAVCGRFHLFSPHNLTDTQWPWHTAIYVRSPPDAAAKPRPRGATLSIHQGASEESTFWLLACSGALLSQRSVLVAAPCVLDKDTQQSLQPTQVRVVLGTQHHAATDKLKTPRHLRVRRTLLVPHCGSLDKMIHPLCSNTACSCTSIVTMSLHYYRSVPVMRLVRFWLSESDLLSLFESRQCVVLRQPFDCQTRLCLP